MIAWEWAFLRLVPTLRVGMLKADALRRAGNEPENCRAIVNAAERRGRRSHAELGNEEISLQQDLREDSGRRREEKLL